jgi:hypothetical protein
MKDELVDGVIQTLVRAAYTHEYIQLDELSVIVVPLDACVVSALMDQNAEPANQAASVFHQRWTASGP